MLRWLLLTLFFIFIFFSSLWSYIYIYRVEYTELGIHTCYPTADIKIKNITCSFTLPLSKIEIDTLYLKKNNNQLFSKIIFSIDPLQFLVWAITPSTDPVPVHEISLIEPSASLFDLSSSSTKTDPLEFAPSLITTMIHGQKIEHLSCQPETYETLFQLVKSDLRESL